MKRAADYAATRELDRRAMGLLGKETCANCGKSKFHHSTWLSWCADGINHYRPHTLQSAYQKSMEELRDNPRVRAKNE